MATTKQKIILKIGSSTLTRGTDQISRGKIEDLARQILALQDRYDLILVTSGAIATAKQFMQLSGTNPIAVKQAMAAIGQPLLLKIYQEVFSDFGLKVAQCLLNYRDFDNESSRTNIVNTINILLENQYLPVINENDTVATEEIKFGDNDKLAALTAALLKVELLVLASDIDGLYTNDPKSDPDAVLIEQVRSVEQVKHLASDSTSAHGTGGMRSKLIAAEICQQHAVEMWIVNGAIEGFAQKAMAKEIPFTRFTSSE
ncbi:MAG: glutamate 5-kinase [Bacteroidota bacterium]